MNAQRRKQETRWVRRGVSFARWSVCLAAALFVIAPLRGEAAQRASVRTDGTQANGPSSGAASSGDGRCVAFYSDATNLLPQGPAGDTNGVRDVYLFNRETSEIQRVSVSTAGGQGNGPSQAQGFLPGIDEDCTCVAFSSDATNLVPDDANGRTDVIVRDLLGPTTERVSVGAGGESNGPSSFPSVSADCSLVAFQSTAANLVAGDTNGVSDIFVHDRVSGQTVRVSVGGGGEQANGRSVTPSISADGNCVAFASAATNLFGPDTNGRLDIYVACGGVVTCRASLDSAGNPTNGDSFLPSLSADGRYVAFKSLASNLVSNDQNGFADVFVHDCEGGTTELISTNSRGEVGNDNSFPPTISGDARFVAFGSFASNLASGLGTGGNAQIYVRDRQLQTTLMVSLNRAGRAMNGSAPDIPPSISLDGDFVAFASLATDLVAGDSNGAMDAFLGNNVTATPTPTATLTSTPTPTPTIACTADENCPEGQMCVDGVCREPTVTATPTDTVLTATPTKTPGPPCFIDLDCPVDHICVDNICEKVPCETDEDCPGGRECEDGFCQPLPMTPTPLPTCTTDEDCPNPEDRCRAGVCVPPRTCDDEDAVVDRVNCRGIRETCLDGTCECGGDCNLDGTVFGNEISVAINILGDSQTTPLSACPAADIIFPPDGQVMGNEITLAVINLGLGCPGEGLPLELFEDRTDEIRTLAIGSATGAPGESVPVEISMTGGAEVATAQMDVLFDERVLTLDDPLAACSLAPRLAATHALSAFRPQRPAAPEGMARLRLFVGDLMFPVDAFAEGPIATCNFGIKPDAALGSVELTGERLNIGDPAGNVFGATSTPGGVTVVPGGECTVPNDCPGAPRETCVERSCSCVGDCNGDGSVFGNEITIAVRILGGEETIDACLAADADGDGEVFSNEITLAVINLGEGCPDGGI